MSTCDTCGTEGEVYVYALPGIPVSVGNCARCTAECLYPYGILVANTATVGGLDHAAAWWREVVEASLPVSGRTMEQFLADVREAG